MAILRISLAREGEEWKVLSFGRTDGYLDDDPFALRGADVENTYALSCLEEGEAGEADYVDILVDEDGRASVLVGTRFPDRLCLPIGFHGREAVAALAQFAGVLRLPETDVED